MGGLELGLEWAGVGHTVWQVEQNAYRRSVLAQHWPNALRFDDVRTVGAHNLPPVDVICGGFPCQDISYAGKGTGLAGERSGLWFEYARIIRELGPTLVIVENVRALLTRGLDAVLGSLADCGYDAEWSMLAASDVGALHRRQRIFIIAVANADGGSGDARRRASAVSAQLAAAGCDGQTLADAERGAVQPARIAGSVGSETAGAGAEVQERGRCGPSVSRSGPDVADATRHVEGRAEQRAEREQVGPCGESGDMADTEVSDADNEIEPTVAVDDVARDSVPQSARGYQWRLAQSDMGGSVDGLPAWLDGSWESGIPRVEVGVANRVNRLAALGDAVVPQVAQVVGWRALEILAECERA